MKALVYHGPNQKSWEEVPNPKIAIDIDQNRLVQAESFGATEAVNSGYRTGRTRSWP